MAEDFQIERQTQSPNQRQLQALHRLAEESQAADGAPPFSEQTLVELGKARPDPAQAPLTVAYGWEGDQLVAAAAVTHEQHDDGEQTLTELTVHPDHRQQGLGSQMAAELSGSVLAPSPGVSHRAWAHGGHPGGPKLARAFNWTAVRELWRMRLPNHVELPAAELAEDVRLRSFRPGRDEQAWLAANAEAFSDHPEQGRLTLADLQARMAEDWFDPEGFLLAFSADDQLLGFHWTKTHPPEPGDNRGMGEVYVVGVVPSARGRRLGAGLTLAGIEYLRSKGVEAVMLYVDADNAAAAGLYQNLGFQIWTTDIQYAPSTESAQTTA